MVENKFLLNIQVCFQVPCPFIRVRARWKCCRWLVTHMTHLYFKEAHHKPRSVWWPREQSRLAIGSHSSSTPNHKLDRTLSGNWSCNFALRWFQKSTLIYMFQSWNRQLIWSAGTFYDKLNTRWGQNNGTTQMSTLSLPTVTDGNSILKWLHFLASRLPSGSWINCSNF